VFNDRTLIDWTRAVDLLSPRRARCQGLHFALHPEVLTWRAPGCALRHLKLAVTFPKLMKLLLIYVVSLEAVEMFINTLFII